MTLRTPGSDDAAGEYFCDGCATGATIGHDGGSRFHKASADWDLCQRCFDDLDGAEQPDYQVRESAGIGAFCATTFQ